MATQSDRFLLVFGQLHWANTRTTTMKRFDYNPPNTRERIAARRKQQHTRRGVRAAVPGPRRLAGSWATSGRIVSLPLLLICLVGLVYVFSAPGFTVQRIEVEGAHVLAEADVAELADLRARSIWFVDPAQVAERLTSNAYIESASVSVTLPNHAHIRLHERQPELRWQVAGTRYLLDADGRVLGTDTTGALTDTLVIEDRSGRTLRTNDRIDRAALELGRALSLRLPSELGVQPTSIVWDTNTGMYVTLPPTRTVVFGSDDRLDEKLAVLRQLLGDGTAFSYLDVRPVTPFYRTDGSGQPSPTPSP